MQYAYTPILVKWQKVIILKLRRKKLYTDAYHIYAHGAERAGRWHRVALRDSTRDAERSSTKPCRNWGTASSAQAGTLRR